MTAQPKPDDKDWTWILERRCPDCGFDAASADRAHLGTEIRTTAAKWRELLAHGEIVTRRPPSSHGEVWSALEYGAHVRDVFEKLVERLTLLMTKDDPTFPNWDQDAAAVVKNYAGEDPSKVAYHLARQAGLAADVVDGIRPEEWDRPGTRSNGSPFTVESLVRYMVHDPIHHIWDVERGFQAIAEAGPSS